jgi:hypothetical protein
MGFYQDQIVPLLINWSMRRSLPIAAVSAPAAASQGLAINRQHDLDREFVISFPFGVQRRRYRGYAALNDLPGSVTWRATT